MRSDVPLVAELQPLWIAPINAAAWMERFPRSPVATGRVNLLSAGDEAAFADPVGALL